MVGVENFLRMLFLVKTHKKAISLAHVGANLLKKSDRRLGGKIANIRAEKKDDFFARSISPKFFERLLVGVDMRFHAEVRQGLLQALAQCLDGVIADIDRADRKSVV